MNPTRKYLEAKRTGVRKAEYGTFNINESLQGASTIVPETKELPPVDRTLKPELTNEERAEQFGQKFDAVKQSQ